mmetsp:Transcript_8254/g.13592  ORF Transcript_8254/g.13592 Transcript_8254/m.13592 type:complete len:217 (-) Transcript_8254:189-839(-)
MLITEAQVPIFAEKILILFRKCRVGNVQLVDLDVARGRVVAIVMMTMAIGTMNHLNSHYSHGNNNNNSTADPTAVDDGGIEIINSTAVMNETIIDIDNTTTTSYDPVSTYSSDNHNAIVGFLLAVIYSTVFSLTMWFLLSLLSYTIYVIREYPTYAEYRAFPNLQDDSTTSSSGTTQPLSSASARSWVSNIPDFSSITGAGGGGYQSVDNPIQMNV